MTLSPADIMALRTSVPARVRCLDTGLGSIAVPFILYLPADDAFALHSYGLMLATSKDPAPLAECLRQERAEPGFIRRILDPREDVIHAALDPAGRKRLDAQRALARHGERIAAEEADQAAERRTRQLNISAITLDDL